jgi:hypothetical protein
MDCRVKPGNDGVISDQESTVMAGLDPAIHAAARTVGVQRHGISRLRRLPVT